MNKAVFLDRDGVVNKLSYHQEQEVIDSPFTVRQFQLLPGVPEAIISIRKAGYLAIIVSNQPGIAKGQLSSATFKKIQQKMNSSLEEKGTGLDGEYYCFHHPEAVVEKYRVNCECRKPKPGLIFTAAQKDNIDLSQSWLIGDNPSDIIAGRAAGCRTILLGKLKCDLCDLMETRNIRPDFVAEDINQAANIILGKTPNHMENIAQDVVNLLREKGLTLGAVESATGGLISHLITNIPGSSDVYQGSITSYSNEIKIRVVGVKEASIKAHGAVSARVAEEMAAGGRKALGVDICVADTGIAGPGGATPQKPVGLFYVGLAHKSGVKSRKHLFTSTREANKMSAALAALRWVKEWLEIN